MLLFIGKNIVAGTASGLTLAVDRYLGAGVAVPTSVLELANITLLGSAGLFLINRKKVK